MTSPTLRQQSARLLIWFNFCCTHLHPIQTVNHAIIKLGHPVLLRHNNWCKKARECRFDYTWTDSSAVSNTAEGLSGANICKEEQKDLLQVFLGQCVLIHLAWHRLSATSAQTAFRQRGFLIYEGWIAARKMFLSETFSLGCLGRLNHCRPAPWQCI